MLAHLAWTPEMPQRTGVTALVQRRAARILSKDRRLATVRDAQLFFSGGPDTQARAESIAREIERDIDARPETARQARKISVATFRLITAMQRGDRAAVARAIEARAAMLPKLNNVELGWHHERLIVIGA